MRNTDITWEQLYKTVISNKDLFDFTAAKYWVAVDAHWKINGRKKIWTFINPFECGSDADIDDKDFIAGSVNKDAFSWYLLTMLTKSTKYYSMDVIRNYKASSLLYEGRDVNSLKSTIQWGDRIYRDYSPLSLAKEITDGNTYHPNLDFVEEINGHLKIDFIKDVLPEDFSNWMLKKTKTKLNFPNSINNKMDFLVWKKVATSKKMTSSHLKDCFSGVVNSSEWHLECWNVLAESENSEAAIKNKYFANNFVKSNYYPIFNKKVHPNLTIFGSKSIVDTWEGSNWSKSSEYNFDSNKLVSWIENTDISKYEDGPSAFFDKLIDEKIIDFIAFSDDDSLFTKKNFINHLKQKWSIV